VFLEFFYGSRPIKLKFVVKALNLDQFYEQFVDLIFVQKMGNDVFICKFSIVHVLNDKLEHLVQFLGILLYSFIFLSF